MTCVLGWDVPRDYYDPDPPEPEWVEEDFDEEEWWEEISQ